MRLEVFTALKLWIGILPWRWGATDIFETFVTMYKTTVRHNPVEHNPIELSSSFFSNSIDSTLNYFCS